ncbi:2-oxoacid:acceptor oxidoreductase subunit alpha [Coprothermobacter proteolyticus]|nr:2-oxoacid:acceptor oxidoreductase subunit alpha [Coprothermobacter proteolyticus]
MEKELFTFIAGGTAGAGIRKAGAVAGYIFTRMGRSVFEMEDYQSLIKGGHNFAVVSSATYPIKSHYMRADLVVATDKRSYHMHKDHLRDGGIMVFNSDAMKDETVPNGIGIPFTTISKKYTNSELRLGVGAVTVLAVSIGMSKDELADVIREQYRDAENNINFAMEIYDAAAPQLFGKFALKKTNEKPLSMISGNEAISLGAVAGGLDFFFAYPMTPASSILHFLAAHAKEFQIGVMHPESELAAINMALGAASMGLKTMVASSGGGMALMEEAFSLSGMAEVPVLAVLGSRPGPSTGVPTYTEQGDLRFAINQGHGEFPRVVASPYSMEEAFYLAAEMLGLVQEFQTLGILLTEKHLGESRMTVDIDPTKAYWAEPIMYRGGDEKYLRYKITEDGISPLLFPPSDQVIKFTSYEHDEYGVSTEDPQMIAKMHEKRAKKQETLVQKLMQMHTVNVFGHGEPVIFTYGSTTMSVLEALQCANLEATVVQPIYLEPFPTWEFEKFKNVNPIVVEQSVMGAFETLIKEKTGIKAKASIRKYDGRPFDPEELAQQIKEVI